MNTDHSLGLRGRNCRVAPWVAAGCLAGGVAFGQEALRVAVEDQQASEARQTAQANVETYTFKHRDLTLLVTPMAGVEYDDNIGLKKEGGQSDVIVKGAVNLIGRYPMAENTLLYLDGTFGYDQYLDHSEYSFFHLGSGSQLAFTVGVGDFDFELHDRFSYFVDAAQEPSVAGSGFYGGLDNVAGALATWNLRDIILQAGYDHHTFVSANHDYDYVNHGTEMVNTRAGFRVHPRLTVGVEGTAAFTTYDQAVLNDNVGYSAGVFGDWRPNSALRVQPRTGYAIYQFDQTSRPNRITGVAVPATDEEAWYVDILSTAGLTDTLQATLSVGHELRLGVESDSVEDWYVRPSLNWRFAEDLSYTAGVFYEHGAQNYFSYATTGTPTTREHYDWYGFQLGANYKATANLTVSLYYRLTARSADSPREYTQNLVGLLLTYNLK